MNTLKVSEAEAIRKQMESTFDSTASNHNHGEEFAEFVDSRLLNVDDLEAISKQMKNISVDVSVVNISDEEVVKFIEALESKGKLITKEDPDYLEYISEEENYMGDFDFYPIGSKLYKVVNGNNLILASMGWNSHFTFTNGVVMGKKGSKYVTISINQELFNDLKVVAESDYRSVRQTIIKLLTKALRDLKI